MLSFRAQLVFVLTVLLLLFALAAGVATIATLDRALQEDGLRDVRQAADARRDQIVSRIALQKQKATALLEAVASNCDQSGRINTACAADALGDWARQERVRYAALSFPGSRLIQRGTPLPADPTLYRNDRGLNLAITVGDAWSGGRLAAVFDAAPLETMAAAPFGREGSGLAVLLNADGSPLIPMTSASAPAPLLAPYCTRHDSGVVSVGGARMVVAGSALPSGGCVVAELSAANLLQPSVRLRNRYLVIAGFFVLFAGGLAVLLSWLMSRPLIALTRRVEAMSRGDFDSVVPRAGPTEIRTFADAFARMARSLKRSHEAVQQSEEKLRLSYRAAHLWPWEASLYRGYFRWMDFSTDQPVVREEPLEEALKRVHAEDRERVRRTLESAEQMGTFHVEFRYQKPDGEMIWLASRGESMRRITGTVLIGVNLDVTHRRRMEELERERESLAASAHLAAELAHEINNPLAAVSGALYLMKGAEPGSAEQAHCLEIATEATNRITHIGRQLLGLYQRSTGAAKLDLARLVREVLDIYREQAGAMSVRLTADLPGEAALTGYAAELRTAIANVVANAMASVSMDGHVVVRVRKGHERRLGREGVRITVADNGAGIAPENRKRVFEAFFSTSEQRGTGLGLWVTSNIVRKHYGTIRVRSSQGGVHQGTTISIFLPRLEGDETQQFGPTRAA